MQTSVTALVAVTLGATGCGNADLDIHKDMQGLEHFRGPAIVDEDGAVGLPGLTAMVSPLPSAKGLSDTRKWGVKAHIERNDPPLVDSPSNPKGPFDWRQMYQSERAKIENLADQPPPETKQP